MDLSLGGIYASSLRGLRDNVLIYVLLLLWGLSEGIVLIAVTLLSGIVWLSSVGAALMSNPESVAPVGVFTVAYLATLLLVVLFLSAATKAGILGFGARVREGRRAATLDFLKGILRFTWPLFCGGIIVGLLGLIPLLLLLLAFKLSLKELSTELLTSGWNFHHALSVLGYLVNLTLGACALQAVVFFWITPWDEMVVLYEMPFPEALARSFTFVFSRRHALRVLLLVVANSAIAIAALILANAAAFTESLNNGLLFALFKVLIASGHSRLSSLFQFVLMPFFAFSQLFLLPCPQTGRLTATPEASTITQSRDTPALT